MAVSISVASLILGAAATGEAQKAREEAASEQKKAQKKQTAMEQAKLVQSRRQKIREERVRRAQILQRAENLGVSSSSGAVGATGALATQTSSALGIQTGEGKAATSISRNLQKAADAETTASNFAAGASLIMQTFSAVGGFETIFKD